MRKLYNVAIVGATGLIGRKFIQVLEKRKFPIKNLFLFASSNSEGKIITAFNKKHKIQSLSENCFKGCDIVFFSAGADVSKIYVPKAVNCGAMVVDNSSAFRQKEDIPLIVPEINGEILSNYNGKLIANPNCSTIQSVLPLKILDDYFTLTRVIYTTFQAVSGSGNKGVNDLNLCRRGKNGIFYPVDISKNCIPQIGKMDVYGYTEEELKMISETKKILRKDIPISSTCVRVPIKNCHGVSVSIELKKEFHDEDIRGIISKMKGIKVVDIPFNENSNGKEEILVGRIKRSFAFKNGIEFYCVGDNTLKGAALNAVQIAEKIISLNKI